MKTKACSTVPRRAILAAAAALIGAGCASPTVREHTAATAPDEAIRRVYPALVRVNVVTMEAENGRMNKYQAAGSGTIVSAAGHVVTNHHVAGRAKRLVCRLADGEEVAARLVGTDPLADIAVLQLELRERKAQTPLPVAGWGDSTRLRVGDPVFSMGSPVGISQSVTAGIVSNTQMIIPQMFWPFTFLLDGEEVGTVVRWIAHDAVIYPGNSGGPLVNAAGEIVGINEIGLGLGGAIPASLARRVAEQLLRTGQVERSWTGVEPQPRLKTAPAERGVLVGSVVRESPAAKAGLQAGDVLVEFDGTPVDCRLPEDVPLFNRLVLETPVGKTVTVAWLRGGQRLTATLTTAGRGKARELEEELRAWGMTARDFSRLAAIEEKRPDPRGVQVHALRPGGPAAEAKPPLAAKDVIREINGKPVGDLAALKALTEDVLRGQTSPQPVLVAFERHRARYLTVVKIGREPQTDRPTNARRAWFAAATQVLTADLATALNLAGKKGVRVTEVYPGHEAEKAGVKVGDLLVAIDGEPIEASQPEHVEVFLQRIRQYRAGAQVTFDALRDGQPCPLKVTLEAPPPAAAELGRYQSEEFEFTVRDLAFDDRTAQQLEAAVQGVLVEKVETAGWAALAHLALDDVLLAIDGRPTPDVKAVETCLKEATQRQAKRVVFFVQRGIRTMFLEVEPNW